VKKRSTFYVAALVVALVSGACDDRNSLDTSAPSPAQCKKDREALLESLLDPVACSTSESCPAGSHCASANQCRWECYSDSDCGGAGRCSCDGFCVKEERRGWSAKASVAECLRDMEMLSSLGNNERPCVLDEDCPFGSHCDQSSNTCEWHCLGSDHPDAGCSEGRTCDCRGLCVAPGARRTPPEKGPDAAVRVSPRALIFRPASAQALPIEIIAESPSAAVSLHVLEPFQIDVPSLSGDGNEATGKSVTIGAWEAAGESWKRQVWVRPVTDLVYEESPWKLDVVPEADAARSVTVLLGVAKAAAGSNVERRSYLGYATPLGAADASAMDNMLPIRAFAADPNRYLVLVDETRTLIPGKTLALDLESGGATTVSWLTDEQGTPRLTADISVTAPPVIDPNGAVRVPIRIALARLGGKLDFDLNLFPSEEIDLSDCGPDDHCSPAEHCEPVLSICVPGPQRAAAAEPGNFIVHEALRAWATQATWLETSSSLGAAQDFRFVEALSCHERSQTRAGVVGYSGLAPFGYGVGGTHSLRDIFKHSGDLNCEHGRFPKTFMLGLQRDAAQRGESAVLGTADIVRACLAELKRKPGRAQAWFEPETQCVSPERFFPALLAGLYGAVGASDPSSSTTRGFRHAQRLLSQWLELQSFLAIQAREESKLETAVPPAELTSATGEVFEPLVLEDVVRRIEEDLGILLDPLVSEALAELHPPVLRTLDYRGPRLPLAFWSFDERDTEGRHVVDVAGNRHLFLGHPYDREAKEGGVRPVDQWVDLPSGDVSLAAEGDLTISMWIEVPRGAARHANALWRYGTDEQDSVIVGLEPHPASSSAKRPFIQHGDRHSTSQRIRFPARLAEGERVHLAFVRDVVRREYSVFVNGVYGGFEHYPNAVPRMTGPVHGRLGLRSYADDYAYWDVLLTAEEIQELYQLGPSHGGGRDHPILSPGGEDRIWSTDLRSTDEQKVGLPVHIVEAATEYLRAAGQLASRSVGAVYAECYAGGPSAERENAQNGLARAARYGYALRGLAEHLYDRATIARRCTVSEQCSGLEGAVCSEYRGESVCAVNGAPSRTDVLWKERWAVGLNELASAQGAVLEATRTVAKCENPLGIDDGAIPLLFGDVQGNNSRFFASSDYLLQQFAKPAVEAAKEALAAARQAWVSQRNSEIQQLLGDTERQRRLEDLERHSANEVIRLCGLTEVDPLVVDDLFQSRVLDANNCFIDRTKPGCSGADPAGSCFRGEVGAAALQIYAAKKDVEIATEAAAAAEARYKLQSERCSAWQVRVNEDIEGMKKHEKRMRSLRMQRAAASAFGSFLSGIASGNAYGAFGGLAQAHATSLGAMMEDAQEEFNLHMQKRSLEEQISACFHEADMIKTQIDGEYLTVERASLSLTSAINQLVEGRARIAQALYEGAAAVNRESKRPLPTVRHHYWVNDAVSSYHTQFAWAKRVTYLSMLATEYELQQSLGLRRRALTAAKPDELNDVLLAVQQEQGARTINGRRPEESTLVLSLRDDILMLASRAEQGDGSRNWTAEKRFGALLADPALAVYSAEGEYLGQGIPLTLSPSGGLRHRCAERLWRVAATIQAAELHGSDPGKPLHLLKRNTFASQWCEGRGDGSQHQVGSVQPAFAALSGRGEAGRASGFTDASLRAWTNIARHQFYQDGYREGASEELAGRGLYGDYILLFPEAGLLEWTNDTQADFPASTVEDVLIRFDFLSVSDLPDLAQP
jgi:hypothetical protein